MAFILKRRHSKRSHVVSWTRYLILSFIRGLLAFAVQPDIAKHPTGGGPSSSALGSRSVPLGREHCLGRGHTAPGGMPWDGNW